MEAIRFINGKYEYITNGISGDVFMRDGEAGNKIGFSPDEIVNDSSFLIYSPMITSYNLDQKSEKDRAILYNDRIVIGTRGDTRRHGYYISVDNCFVIMGAWYKTYIGRWELTGLSPSELVKYLNLIEEKGISYVRDLYLELKQKELEVISRSKEWLNESLSIPYGTQNANFIHDRILEAADKSLILAQCVADIEKHKKLYP